MSSGININFSVTADEAQMFIRALKSMQSKDVLAGFPADQDRPREDENGNATPITNAGIAYCQNQGMPEHNVPARPFMAEGIEEKRQTIADAMERVGIAALDGDEMRVEQGLYAVAAIARDAIKRKIVEGPFEPLAESTLLGRVNHGGEIGKAAKAELDRRESGHEPGVDLSRPLNFTGQLRNAVQGVVRDRE